MKTLVCTQPGQFEYAVGEKPELRKGQAIIKIRRIGICGTDLHAFEGLRYYDILRWGIAAEELNRQFTGMKLTNNPSGYTKFPVDNEGYYLVQKRNFKKGINELWPIPQTERDINPNLTQNPGY